MRRSQQWNRPSQIDYEHLRFAIFDAPNTANVDIYIRELPVDDFCRGLFAMESSRAVLIPAYLLYAIPHDRTKLGTTEVVRACEKTYEAGAMKSAGIMARQDSAEDFSRLDALLFTAMARIFIPAYCFALP